MVFLLLLLAHLLQRDHLPHIFPSLSKIGFHRRQLAFRADGIALELLLAVENVPFANDKVGPAAPPIKTEAGWLTLFHAVDKESTGRGQKGWDTWWNKRYTAGIMLLDLKNPYKILGMSKTPLIAPTLPWETDEGFRTNVIFPGGMIAEDDGSVKIYYGASDTVECLATTTVDALLALCTEKP